MSSSGLKKELIELWQEILKCNHCELPTDYTPQFRPVGSSYMSGGVVFVQINPGHIGYLSDNEIKKKYKRESSRQRARDKQKKTTELIKLETKFSKNPSIEHMCSLTAKYKDAMRKHWGWPPGKYYKTIEKHGAKFDDIAVINLAQCPIPNDKYSKKHFSNCWQIQTKKLLAILKPKIIVAQGKVVLNFLKKRQLGNGVLLIEGVHHASRESNEVKNNRFNDVRNAIGKNLA